jgi:hypothetical protein
MHAQAKHAINIGKERDTGLPCPKIKENSWGLSMDILRFRGQGLE